MKQTLRSAGWLLRLSWQQDRLKTAVSLVLVLGERAVRAADGPGAQVVHQRRPWPATPRPPQSPGSQSRPA